VGARVAARPAVGRRLLGGNAARSDEQDSNVHAHGQNLPANETPVWWSPIAGVTTISSPGAPTSHSTTDSAALAPATPYKMLARVASVRACALSRRPSGSAHTGSGQRWSARSWRSLA